MGDLRDGDFPVHRIRSDRLTPKEKREMKREWEAEREREREKKIYVKCPVDGCIGHAEVISDNVLYCTSRHGRMEIAQ